MKQRSSRPGPRRRLLRDLLLLLTLTSGSLLVAVFYAGEMLRGDLAVEQLRELAHKTSEDFSGFFRPVEKNLRMAQGWGAAGDLDLDHPKALARRFIPVLENLSKASALVLADSDGRSLYLTHDGEAWVSRSVDPGGNAVWRRWSGSGNQIGEHDGQSEFDPRTRPWFQGALEATVADPVYWSRPYLFFTAQTAGLTGAVRFRHPDQPQHDYVIGLDLPLEGILRALSELKIGERGSAFLTEADGSVLLPPANGERSDSAFPVTLASSRFDAGPVLDAVDAWGAAGRPARQAVEFRSSGPWWAWLHPIGDRPDGLWLGITVPEVDFLGALQSGWHLVLLVGVLVLLVGLALTLTLTRRYGRQLKALPSLTGDPEDFEERVLTLIHYGESPTVEFKSTMRTNLKSGKVGKEIELAWLKGVVGFLNTDGGVLLIGVNDAGEVIGIEADNFENDDKCLLHFKNLMNQHIGAEFSKYLQAEVRPVVGKTIVAVSCEKAREPVFLMIGKNEEFHIRSGPSSMKLTPRQMLQYLNVR